MCVFCINKKDNVLVALQDINKGQLIEKYGNILIQKDIKRGHKIANTDIKKGDEIIKYGFPIGKAKIDIKKGEEVFEGNIQTNLDGLLNYQYHKDTNTITLQKDLHSDKTFLGFKRDNGTVGTRNEVWIIPTVFCINTVVNKIQERVQSVIKNYKNVDGCIAFPHHFGCSQMGEDHKNTQKVLAGLINNPNAGAVLVVGLGCENNNIEEFKKVLGTYNPDRVKFLNSQDIKGNEVDAGVDIVKELLEYANKSQREKCPISTLKIGLKCGSSDGFSGITANPLIGLTVDKLIQQGATAVMTEVPEMFGAEHLLMNRAKNKQIFDDIVQLINNFKNYYISHGEIISDNPSPGNKKGGISTLEEKSLGCIQKGGNAEITGVLKYAEPVKELGLNLLQSPGNDGVSTTALAVSGCNIILYSTGRGTPFGTAVPGIKISSNTNLFENKPNWIDFNAGVLVDTKTTLEQLSDDLITFILTKASGEKTCDEIHGFREINIWKDGVTL